MVTKRVRIEWIDSYATPGWQRMSSITNESDAIVSYGFLIKESKDNVTISSSLSAFEGIMDPLTIPRRAIIKMKVVK